MNKEYSTLELLESLENYLDCTINRVKMEVLKVIQCINGREQGLIDFCAYYFSGNYKYNLKQCVEFIAEEQDSTLKEFVEE